MGGQHWRRGREFTKSYTLRMRTDMEVWHFYSELPTDSYYEHGVQESCPVNTGLFMAW